MNEIVKILPNFRKFNDYINNVKNNLSPIMLSGLTDAAKVHFAYSTSFYSDKPICIITYNEMQAKKILKDFEYFSKDVVYFPKKEVLTYDYLAESNDNYIKRINALNSIYTKKAKIIVTTIEAVSQEIVPKDALYSNIFTLKENTSIDLEQIKIKLNELGYERCDLVEQALKYSIRGGIIDIGISTTKGIREGLSLRIFDVISIR